MQRAGHNIIHETTTIENENNKKRQQNEKKNLYNVPFSLFFLCVKFDSTYDE